MRRGKGFISVYATVRRGQGGYRDLTPTKATSRIPLVIFGNKCDLDETRIVSKQEGEELAEKLAVRFMETSALANINVERAFQGLLLEIRKQQPAAPLIVIPEQKKQKQKKKLKCILL
jgi:GTPase SAR1 family protein